MYTDYGVATSNNRNSPDSNLRTFLKGLITKENMKILLSLAPVKILTCFVGFGGQQFWVSNIVWGQPIWW
jgi:hypothetical protein